MLIKVLSLLLRWALRQQALKSWFGYEIHANARIGLAWVFPAKLITPPDSSIDHFIIAIHMYRIEIGEKEIFSR